jgi:hypothetical protein
MAVRLAYAPWIVLGAVVLVTAAAPSLREQVGSMPDALMPRLGEEPDPSEAHLAQIQPWCDRAVAFVEQHHPDDPDMMLAAGVLAGDVSLLQRAAEASDDPVAWAAYCELLESCGPGLTCGGGFERIGLSGIDPADTAAVEQEERRIAESGLPAKLTPQEVQPNLRALRAWQDADPENGLPVALEARYLYALHRDRDALIVWSQAGRMPLATPHAIPRAREAQCLLTAMGMPQADALASSWQVIILPSFARLRSLARVAYYEGRRAQMADDPWGAINWWQSTVGLGRNLQDSAETIIQFHVGVAIEGIGARPVWRWHHDNVTGIPDGPLLGGRYFHGPQHDFYVEHMDWRAEEDMIENLAGARVRSGLVHEYTGGPGGLGAFEDYYQANRHIGAAALWAFFAIVVIAVLVLFGTWSRRAADDATRLSSAWQFLLAVLILLPAAALVTLALASGGAGPALRSASPAAGPAASIALPAGQAAVAATLRAARAWVEARPYVAIGLAAASVLAVLLLPLLGAVLARAGGARVRTAWRGNLRRVLPVAVALSALLFLYFNVTALRIRGAWFAKWSAPGVTEFSDMVDQLGGAWQEPDIPFDAWRAELPPGA